jgi:perosamine synthetase
VLQSRKIPVCAPVLGERELEYLTKCIRSSWISSLGPFVAEFEGKFAQFCETQFGVTTNSGTTALHLALVALGIGKGDEVILPAFTMIASINAIEYTGAKAVLVDADRETWNMDVSAIRRKITEKTKAIMPVHIYGHPTDMDPITEIASELGLRIIEDAAEAHGARYKGRTVGSLGDVASFSFYSNKIITTGEGGMNVTEDEELAEKMRWLRAHAFGRGGKHFWHEALGFGYRMTSLQAAVGLAQLERIDDMIARRVDHARLYNELLGKLSEDKIVLPPEKKWARNVYWMYSILVSDQSKRDGLISWLSERGIETRTFFYPIHRQPYYAPRYDGESYEVADDISKRGINLPSGSGLTDEDISYVSDCVLDFFKRN